jgi:hypothetical protein
MVKRPEFLRIVVSAALEMSMRDDPTMACRIATALTPILNQRMPRGRKMVKNVFMVSGTFTPAAAILLRVIPTVLLHVVMPIAR